MTWLITNTGREHHLAGYGQQFNCPAIDEIAHALAQINRFTGHCSRPYSVAEHSLLVATIAAAEGASPVAQLAALLHDAHEAYVGDVSSPAKWAIGEPWEVFEHSQEMAVHNALGIRTAMFNQRPNIKRWDLIALATERRDLLPHFNPATSTPWRILDTPGQEVQPYPRPNVLKSPERSAKPWNVWRDMFLAEYIRLSAEATATSKTAT